MNDITQLLKTTNVYVDESGHTGNRSDNNMVFGALWISYDQSSLFQDAVRTVKRKHGIPSHREIKWTKVSKAKLEYYKDLTDVFFEVEQVNFRAVVIDNSKVDYEAYRQTKDDFYYKMQYLLIRNIAERRYGDIRVFVDYKDAWSGVRAREQTEYLKNTKRVNCQSLTVQPLRSHEVIGLQISDLLTGAVMYANRPESARRSKAKEELARYIEERASRKLTETTSFASEKVNILIWEPQG